MPKLRVPALDQPDTIEETIETEPLTPEPPQPRPSPPSRPFKPKPQNMTMEEYCNALTEADWESRKLYITREGLPEVIEALKAKHKSKYSGIISGPFDDGYPFGKELINRIFGGGSFRVVLNWRDSPRTDHVEKQVLYSELEGEPIWTAREREAGIGQPEEEEDDERSNPQADLVRDMLDRVEAAHEREVEAIKAASQPQQTAVAGVVDITMSAANKLVEAMGTRIATPPGPSVGDKVIEAALSRMLQPPPDAIEQFMKLQEVQARVRQMAGEGEGTSGLASRFGELKSLLEMFGIKMPTIGDATEAARPTVPEPPSMSERLMDIIGKAVEQGPLNWVQAYGQLRALTLQFKEREFQLEMQRRNAGVAPAQPGAAPGTAQPQPQPQANPQQIGAAVMMERMMTTMSRLYANGVSGEDAAQTIADAFALEFASIAPHLEAQGEWYNNPMVLNWIAQNFPPLATAVQDAGFSPWGETFWKEWKALTSRQSAEPSSVETDAETTAPGSQS